MLHWQPDRRARPDIYYVNVPRRKSKVTLRTIRWPASAKHRAGQDINKQALLRALTVALPGSWPAFWPGPGQAFWPEPWAAAEEP